MMNSDREFLEWLAERLVNVYGESPNVDFVQRLRVVAAGLPDNQPDTRERLEARLAELLAQREAGKLRISGDQEFACPECGRPATIALVTGGSARVTVSHPYIAGISEPRPDCEPLWVDVEAAIRSAQAKVTR
jgi:hypothetical protein